MFDVSDCFAQRRCLWFVVVRCCLLFADMCLLFDDCGWLFVWFGVICLLSFAVRVLLIVVCCVLCVVLVVVARCCRSLFVVPCSLLLFVVCLLI